MASIRKYSSIFFLALMLLNAVGYYSCLVAIKNQFADKVMTKIRSGVNEPGSDLIFKLPLALPYSLTSGEYELAQGEISHDGVIYQFVKQKHYNDTLYIMCVRDHQTTKANNKIKDYSRSLTGENNKSQTSSIETVVISAKYYLSQIHSVVSADFGWSLDFRFAETVDNYHFIGGKNIFHPPKSIA